ncbi:MAG: hypothetical protein AAGE52_37935 [Myxococcota bacterium]
MARPTELIARALVERLEDVLRDRSATVAVDGRGIRWHVIAAQGERAVRINCLHSGHSGALVLGAKGNRHLRHVSAQRRPAPRVGTEYDVSFEHEGTPIATGRTQDEERTLDAVCLWLSGEALSVVSDAHSFVDREQREGDRIASLLRAGLRGQFVVARDNELGPNRKVWVYGEGRSCQVASLDNGLVGCALLLASTQVARLEISPSQTVDVVQRWLEHASIATICASHPQTEVAPHADLFERGEISQWLWANLLDGSQTNSVLGGYRPLIVEILRRPIVSRFFAFTSLNRLCFSLCSHFPFETRGLPVISPEGVASYRAVTEQGVIEGRATKVAAFLEQSLSTIGRAPWHGVAAEALIPSINRALASRGLEECARRVQRKQWWDVAVESSVGRVRVSACHDDTHYCSLSYAGSSGEERRRRNTNSPDEAAALIDEWLGLQSSDQSSV